MNRNGVARLNSMSSDAAVETTANRSTPVFTQNLVRKRPRRVCRGVAGLLPVYSKHHSNGQQLLLHLNGDKQDHDSYVQIRYFKISSTYHFVIYGSPGFYRFVALEELTSSKDGLRVLISSRNVYLMSSLKLALNTNPCILTLALA